MALPCILQSLRSQSCGGKFPLCEEAETRKPAATIVLAINCLCSTATITLLRSSEYCFDFAHFKMLRHRNQRDRGSGCFSGGLLCRTTEGVKRPSSFKDRCCAAIRRTHGERHRRITGGGGRDGFTSPEDHEVRQPCRSATRRTLHVLSAACRLIAI